MIKTLLFIQIPVNMRPDVRGVPPIFCGKLFVLEIIVSMISHLESSGETTDMM